MNRIGIVSFFVGTLIFLDGCASAQFARSRVDQGYPPRTPPTQIELFRSSTPTKKFIEIGAVNACCSTDTAKLIELLRTQASEHGGDALLGLDVNAKGGAAASVIRYE